MKTLSRLYSFYFLITIIYLCGKNISTGGIQSLPVSQKWSKGPRLMESAVANRHACFQIPFSDAYHSNVNVQAWPHWQTLAKMNLCHSGEVMVFAILP